MGTQDLKRIQAKQNLIRKRMEIDRFSPDGKRERARLRERINSLTSYEVNLKGGTKVFNAPNDYYAELLRKTFNRLDK